MVVQAPPAGLRARRAATVAAGLLGAAASPASPTRPRPGDVDLSESETPLSLR